MKKEINNISLKTNLALLHFSFGVEWSSGGGKLQLQRISTLLLLTISTAIFLILKLIFPQEIILILLNNLIWFQTYI